MQIIINIPKEEYETLAYIDILKLRAYIENGKPLPECHGRLGDLDELEQRISNFVEHDANITDEYTVIRQRFIVDGIKQTPTIIEADRSEGA